MSRVKPICLHEKLHLVMSLLFMQLNDVVGNEDAVGRLKCIAKDGNMPHLILTVPLSIFCQYASNVVLIPEL
jgi:hypothetical protein